MAETLKKRSEVEENLKWDTSLIFKTKEDMLAELDRLKKLSADIEKEYKGQLTDKDKINACLDKYNEFLI